MASTFPESYNPFEAPAAGPVATLAGPVGTDVELIRRRYLGREASIRSIGMLSYIVAFFTTLVALGYLAMAIYIIASPPPQFQDQPINPGIFLGIAGMVALVFAAIFGAVGFGLRRLQTWARWVVIVLGSLSLLYMLGVCGFMIALDPTIGGIVAAVQVIPAAITGYILYLMASAKGGVVFSPSYREVVRQTPHIRYKASLFVKILLGLLVAIIALAVVGALMSGSR